MADPSQAQQGSSAAALPATDSTGVVPSTSTTVPAGEQIEVDQRDTDDDSAYGDDA